MTMKTPQALLPEYVSLEEDNEKQVANARHERIKARNRPSRLERVAS
jgi:hypothetical protein